MRTVNFDKKSIRGRMNTMSASILIPMLVLAIFVISLLVMFHFQYSSVSTNIATASQFSQNFKDDVDLKMYYFVIGNSTELPLDEVHTAKELAQTLLANSENSESRKAANNVINLCGNLESCIQRIQDTEGYDKRIEQLDTNIYVITKLIVDQIYNYLYHEAGVMANIQKDLRRWLIVDISAAVGVMLIIAVFSLRSSYQISKSITDPIDLLSQRVEEIGRGDLTGKTPVAADDEKLRTLSVGVEDMAIKLERQIELNRQEQIRLRGIELSLIQAQINPHFLYNTLDAIVWLIETGKNEEAEEMVTSLSTYFRSFLSNGKDIITVGEECQHVSSYLRIQQVRYKDILDYEIDVDESIFNCLIPKMTLQPMVENAIYHGVKPKRGRSKILVKGGIADGIVTLSVHDNGVGMDKDALEELRGRVFRDDHSSFGLVAAYKRLCLVYGSDCIFTIDSELGEGTVITIRIPFKTGEDNNETAD